MICLLAIEFLATTTTVHIKLVENMWDKANHFIAFFVLYILLSFAYRNFSRILKIGLLLGFGLQIEIVQEVIGRSDASILDVFADSIGIIIGIVIVRFLRKINIFTTKL